MTHRVYWAGGVAAELRIYGERYRQFHKATLARLNLVYTRPVIRDHETPEMYVILHLPSDMCLSVLPYVRYNVSPGASLQHRTAAFSIPNYP